LAIPGFLIRGAGASSAVERITAADQALGRKARPDFLRKRK
jgi:hypothetical protein